MRTFIVVTTAAAALFSSAAFAQQSSQGTASIPDFSGIWAHPSFPGFEPLPLGATSVTNKARRPQTTDADGRILPPTNNILVSNPAKLVGDYNNPILKPQAAEAVKRQAEIELNHGPAPTPTIQCWPEPVPYIFNGVAIEMLQQPDRITFLYPNDHQVRHVRLNDGHPAQVTPSWYGDSIGHYEGDTLVIDTVRVKTGRPFAMVDFYGTPYTAALHVVERYRLLDYEVGKEGLERNAKENLHLRAADAGSAPDYAYRGKLLQLQFTVEDDGVFTMPWSATVTYQPGLETWREVVCPENTQELVLAGRAAAIPRADKPDF